VSYVKAAEPLEMPFWMWSWVGCKQTHVRRGCTFAQSGQYNWTVHVRRRCDFLSNYFDYLL